MKAKNKKKLKALYSELQGYLKHAPIASKEQPFIIDLSLLMRFNLCVKEIEEISGEEYSRFSITLDKTVFPPSTYKNSLSGLISRLHEEYFTDEPNPLHESPNTVMTQIQEQGQSVHIQMIVDITDIINDKIGKYDDESKEKGFLQKLKSSLRSISNVKQLIQTILKLAKDSGLDINEAWKIFT